MIELDDTPAPLPTDEQIASLLQENERMKAMMLRRRDEYDRLRNIEKAARQAVVNSGKESFNALVIVLGEHGHMIF